MRELKFRAMDDDGEFVYFTMRNGHKPFIRISELLHRLGEWQQFTGLKDKNGVEIYEGDILTYSRNDSDWTEQVEVCYNELSAGFSIKSLGKNIWITSGSLYFTMALKLEVSGNIYEKK